MLEKLQNEAARIVAGLTRLDLQGIINHDLKILSAWLNHGSYPSTLWKLKPTCLL